MGQRPAGLGSPPDCALLMPGRMMGTLASLRHDCAEHGCMFCVQDQSSPLTLLWAANLTGQLGFASHDSRNVQPFAT